VGPGEFGQAGTDKDFTCFRKLDGVVHKIDQHLPQAGRIALHAGRNIVVDENRQLKAFLLRFSAQYVTDLFDAVS